MSSLSESTCPYCPNSARLFTSQGLKTHITRMDKVIPRGARSVAARRLCDIIESCIAVNGVDEWCALLSFSYRALRTPEVGGPGSLTAKVKANIEAFSYLSPDDGAGASRSTSLNRTIEAKVHEGDLRGAVRLLMSEDTIAPSGPGTFAALQSKHPSPYRPLSFPTELDLDCPALSVKVEDVSLAVSSFHSGSAAGLDGIRPAHLKELTSGTAGDSGVRLMEALTNLCNFLLSGTLNPQLESFIEEELREIDDAEHPKVLVTSEANTPSGDRVTNGSPPIYPSHGNLDDKNFYRSASAALVGKEHDRLRKISTPANSKHGLQHISSKVSTMPSNPSFLESVPEGKQSRVNSTDAFGKKLTVPKTPKRSPSTSSFQYMSTPFHGSTLSAFEKPSEFASQFSLKSVTESLAPITYCCGCRKKEGTKKEPSKYFDLQLLKDPIYLVILFSNCTSAISYTNFIILVPSYAKECGFDKTLGAYLLSIISALDLVGRIGGSAISDVVSTPKRYFFIFGLLLSGMSLAALPLFSSYGAISVFCSVFGLASGINTGVTALVMTEMLGTERLMSSYGISLFMNGILQLIGPPICGFWFEYTHSYKSLFVTLGFILVGGGCLWGFVPCINKRRRKQKLRLEAGIKA